MICRTVPRIGDGICTSCHGCLNPGWSKCWSCDRVESQLSQPCAVIVPISLYEVGYQLHHQLRTYKGAPSEMSREFLIKTAAILGYFLQLHGPCIEQAAGGAWDTITSVPSSTDRDGEHPLVTAIKLLPDVRDQYEPLLARGTVQSHFVVVESRLAVGHVLPREQIVRSLVKSLVCALADKIQLRVDVHLARAAVEYRVHFAFDAAEDCAQMCWRLRDRARAQERLRRLLKIRRRQDVAHRRGQTPVSVRLPEQALCEPRDGEMTVQILEHAMPVPRLAARMRHGCRWCDRDAAGSAFARDDDQPLPLRAGEPPRLAPHGLSERVRWLQWHARAVGKMARNAPRNRA
jgi:hypothetical protein